MRFRFLVLLLLPGVESAVRAQQKDSIESRGADLYHACQASVRVMDTSKGHPPSASDFEDEEFCRGYFMAFNDFYSVEPSTICLGGASMGTTIRVYVAYMDKNPKLMDEWMITGVGRALRENYPCPDPKPAPKP